MTPQQQEKVTPGPINLCMCPWVVHLLALSYSLPHPKMSLCVKDCVDQRFQLRFQMNFDKLNHWILSSKSTLSVSEIGYKQKYVTLWIKVLDLLWTNMFIHACWFTNPKTLYCKFRNECTSFIIAQVCSELVA